MYSSSSLDGPSKSGCWKQLAFSEKNADSLFPLEYRSYLGQAAHAVLQYVVERGNTTEEEIRATAEEVGNLLIFEGRTFRGHQEPPLPADEVYPGVDIAVNYVLANPLSAEGTITLLPEQEWAHPKLPYRALIDLVAVFEEGDEDSVSRVAEVTDYKSSWQAGEDELNTLQRWGQAICVWRNIPLVREKLGGETWVSDMWEGVDIIRRRIVNLRTWKEYPRDIHLDNEDEVAELERWEKRIETLCERAEGAKKANPGAGCLSCAYRHICDDVWPLADEKDLGATAMAKELACVEAQRSLIIKALKESGIKEKPEYIPGGWVGYKETSPQVFRKGQEVHILNDWFKAMAAELPDELEPPLTSMLSALALSKSNLDAFAKALYPQRAKGIGEIRKEYVAGITDTIKRAQFGVWKDE